MTNLLLRLFVKNSGDMKDASVRTAYGQLSGWVGTVCNVLLCVLKLLVGLASGSVSITADAVNNLSDATSSLVTLFGFRFASKPADPEHPYGHDRMEYLSGLIVAALILLVGAELAKTSIQKIFHPEAVEFSPAIVIVLVLSIGVKLWMALFNTKLGKKIGSAALFATAADSRNDCLSTTAVLLACIAEKLFHVQIDGYVGLAVALFILYSGVQIAKDTVSPLLGQAPDESLVHAIAGYVTAPAEVLGIHDLIVHDYGPGRRFASVHAEIDYHMDVLDAHEMIDHIERTVKQELKVDLVIHYDPIVTDDAEINAAHQEVVEILHSIDPNLAIHDFRLVRGKTHSNLIFDLVLPFDLSLPPHEIQSRLERELSKDGHNYTCVITFDTSAFNDPHTSK